MKKLVLSALTVLATGAMAVGATRAVFTAQDTIAGNTIATATILLDAKGETNGTTLAKPIASTGLVPGALTAWARGALHNQSSVPVRAYMYVTNVTGDACDKVVLQVTTGHAGSDASERTRTVYHNWLMSMDDPSERVEVTGTPPFASIGANITQVIQQQAQLHESADNSYINKTCTWDEVFVAETLTP